MNKKNKQRIITGVLIFILTAMFLAVCFVAVKLFELQTSLHQPPKEYTRLYDEDKMREDYATHTGDVVESSKGVDRSGVADEAKKIFN